MKKRLGFVSNSSSASFLVELDKERDETLYDASITITIGELLEILSMHADYNILELENEEDCKKIYEEILEESKTLLQDGKKLILINLEDPYGSRIMNYIESGDNLESRIKKIFYD